VAESPTPRLENFSHVLRMLGWFSLMQDAGRWNSEQRAAARAEFALYKRALRPLIRTAGLDHLSERPDRVHWDDIEYYSRAERRGALYALGGSGPETVHRFRLRGLDPQLSYTITFNDRVAPVQVRRGT
jgi:hypothetical protein